MPTLQKHTMETISDVERSCSNNENESVAEVLKSDSAKNKPELEGDSVDSGGSSMLVPLSSPIDDRTDNSDNHPTTTVSGNDPIVEESLANERHSRENCNTGDSRHDITETAAVEEAKSRVSGLARRAAHLKTGVLSSGSGWRAGARSSRSTPTPVRRTRTRP